MIEALPEDTILGELVDFCHDQGTPCFAAWPKELLAEYLEFHAGNNSLGYVREPSCRAGNGGKVIGLAIGWQCRSDELEQHWQRNNPEGDVFLFSQIVCRAPGALRSLAVEFIKRYPHWPALKLMARRYKRGRLVVYPARLIERLLWT